MARRFWDTLCKKLSGTFSCPENKRGDFFKLVFTFMVHVCIHAYGQLSRVVSPSLSG